jgi:excisionase family DNA binding protein
MGVKAISRYLNIGERSARRLIKRQEIPAMKLGGTWVTGKNELARQLFDKAMSHQAGQNVVGRRPIAANTGQ